MALESGKRIGPYEVVCRLGAGGMGEVYRARDVKLNREVALKMMLEGAANDPDLVARFEREAQTLAALNHPNIAQIYGYEETAGGLALIMELVEGPTLAERLSAGPLPIADAIDLTRQMADALAYAHERAVIHRDLKPANVKLRPDGTVKILDFGLAKKIEAGTPDGATMATALTMAGAVMGTPGYMAPELLRGGQADVRTDVFALGVLLFELFTGRHPFNRPSVFEVGEAILNPHSPVWPADAPPVPDAVRIIVQKAIEKNADARYQAVRDLRNDLRLAWPSTQAPAPLSGSAEAPGPADVQPAAPQSSPMGSAMPATSGASTGAVTARTARFPIAVAAAVAVLGALGFAAWRFLASAPAIAPAGDVRHTQVTRVGNVRGVAFSPDGRMAAYVARTGEGARVMVRDVAGTGASLEIWRGDIVLEIQWMPDASHVVVSGIAPGAKGVSVLLVPRLTGAPRPLIEAGAHLAVSPDGSEVALAFQNTKGFRIVRLDGGPTRKVEMQGFQFLLGLDWGAATNRIAVLTQNADNSSSVWIVSPDGSSLRKIYTDSALLASLRWSPFGNVIYLIRSRNEAAEVVRLDPPDREGDAGATVLLTGLPWDPSDQYQQQASLSTDGRRLLHVRGSASSNLWKMNTGAPAEPAAVTEGTSRYGPPTVSPDGKWMAASLGSAGQSHIVKVPIAGGEPIDLTTGTAADRNPVWSPDGTRVAFVSTRGGAPRIWLADPEGRPPAEVSGSDADVDARIAWAPDGKLLWQLPGSHDYAIQDLVSGARETLARAAGDKQWTADARFAPRGDRLALWINRGTDKTGLSVMRWPERIETPILPGDFFPAGWSPGADWIYAYEYLGRDVVRVSPSGGKPQPIGRFPQGTIEGCTVTPDGRAVLCGLGETDSDAWLVENFDPRAPQPSR